MRARWAWVTILVLIVSSMVVAALGTSQPTSVEERAHAIAERLRCPVCQNLSVAESPSRLAGEMRSQIRSMLAAGSSPSQIRRHFADAYGDWVLLDPPRGGLGVLTWSLPLGASALGALAVAVTLRKRRDPMFEPPSPEARRRIAAELQSVEEPS